MLISDTGHSLSAFTHLFAPLIIPASFCLSTLMVLMIDRTRGFPAGFWLVVDCTWITASVAAFLIAAWSIAAETPRREAAMLKSAMADRLADINRDVPPFSLKYCGVFRGAINENILKNRSDALQSACNEVQQIIYIHPNIYSAINSDDFVYDVPLYPGGSGGSGGEIGVNLIEDYGESWSDILFSVVELNQKAQEYNRVRPLANATRFSDIARDAWIWIFPFVAGFRINRSLVDFRRRVTAEA